MSRVVITGAGGLVGGYTVDLLRQNGIMPVLLTRSDPPAPGFTATDYSFDSLCGILRPGDVVVHLAANRGGASREYAPFQVNEILTETVLRAMCEAGCSRMIYMSSISVYSDLSCLPWREDQAADPSGFYGLSKLTGEYLCKQYAKRGLEYTIFRCAHILGIEDRGYMLSRFMQGAYRREPLCVKGKSVAKREFIYVKDVAAAILWALRSVQSVNKLYNLGAGIGYTNYEIAEAVNRAFGNPVPIRYLDEENEGITSSVMDVSRMGADGFTARYGLDMALADIFTEYRERMENGEK